MSILSRRRTTPGGEEPPRLLHAVRTAFGFVWRSARRDFLISAGAEVAGALALGALLLSGQRLVTKLTAEQGLTAFSEVVPETVVLGVALAVSGLAAVFVRRYRWLVGEQVTRHVQEEIVEVSVSVDYQMYESQDFHDQLDRSNMQVSESSYAMAYDVLSLLNVLATSIVVVMVLVRTVPEVLGVILLVAIPSVVAARASARLAYQTTYQLTAGDRLRFYLYGALTGKHEARELRIFGLSGMLRNRWAGLYDDRMGKIRLLVRRQVLFDGIATLIGAVVVAAVLLILVQAGIDGRITVGDAAVAIVAMQQLTGRLRLAASASGSLRQSTFFLDEFARFRKLRPDDHADPPATEPLARGNLVIDGVSFRYPGTDALVLDDVSLEIAPGEIVALVGVSGSGKTTLAHLVAGLYRPTTGTITFDGVDITTIPRSVYWRSLAVVFQDFVRYELTGRENIALGDHQRQDDVAGVAAAARRAGIDQALEALPAGYETMMSRAYDDGADLSVGQWQRVAVARAFFREAPLLVLDEPAAALDAVAEQRLYERMVELCSTRSVLLISHRFSTVRMAHRICVVERGRIIEQGSHRQLMELDGRYAELFNLQASGYRGDETASGSPTEPVFPAPEVGDPHPASGKGVDRPAARPADPL